MGNVSELYLIFDYLRFTMMLAPCGTGAATSTTHLQLSWHRGSVVSDHFVGINTTTSYKTCSSVWLRRLPALKKVAACVLKPLREKECSAKRLMDWPVAVVFLVRNGQEEFGHPVCFLITWPHAVAQTVA